MSAGPSYAWTSAMALKSTINGYWKPFIGLMVLLYGMPLTAAAQDPIHWSIAHTDKDVIRAGQTFDVDLTAEIDPTWHLTR